MRASPRIFAMPFVGLLLVLLAPCVGCGGRLINAEHRGQVQWGEPVNGLQAGVSVNQYRPGQRARLIVTYAIRNIGDAPLRVMALPYYAGPARYFAGRGPVEVDTGSWRLRWVEPQRNGAPPESAYEFLEPGAELTLTGGIDPGYYRLGGTFDAEVAFVYELHPPAAATAPKGSDGRAAVWTGRARSAPVKARVRF